jgi:hypothetical protein
MRVVSFISYAAAPAWCRAHAAFTSGLRLRVRRSSLDSLRTRDLR